MPSLEAETGILVILAVTAGMQLVDYKASGNDTTLTTLLLTSILLQTTIIGLWPMSTALGLTEAYTRWRIPPLRAYWAGVFHVLGALVRVTCLGTFLVLLLSDTGVFLRLLPHASWVPGTYLGDGVGLLIVYVVAWRAAVRTKQREMDPETKTTTMKPGRGGGGGGGGGVGAPLAGFVARGYRVRFWWMYGVANWVRDGRMPPYEMSWDRHLVTEPVAEAGDRLGTLEEIGLAEVVRLRAEFWLALVLYVVINGAVLRIFWKRM